MAAPIALGLAITLLAGVAVKRMLDRVDRTADEVRGDDDPNRPRTNVLADWGEVADFSLVDTEGRAFGRKELLGKIWVIDFVFTGCSGPCIPMTQGLRTAVQDLRASPTSSSSRSPSTPRTTRPRCCAASPSRARRFAALALAHRRQRRRSTSWCRRASSRRSATSSRRPDPALDALLCGRPPRARPHDARHEERPELGHGPARAWSRRCGALLKQQPREGAGK